VTNAKKHGAGPIKVTFMPGAPGHCELCVLDEGEGLPGGFAVDRHGNGGLGMKVVSTRVMQIEGKLSTCPNPAGRGTCFIVSFPCDAPEAEAPARGIKVKPRLAIPLE